MIIIRKKMIILVSIIVLISIFACGIATNKTENTIQTVALPVTNKVIVIDAGHGVPDEGAQSSSRNDRSSNKFKNCIKTAKFIRTIRCNSCINKK